MGVGAGVVSEVAEAAEVVGPLRGVALAMHKLRNLFFVFHSHGQDGDEICFT